MPDTATTLRQRLVRNLADVKLERMARAPLYDPLPPPGSTSAIDHPKGKRIVSGMAKVRCW
jgi:hypothetical protein